MSASGAGPATDPALEQALALLRAARVADAIPQLERSSAAGSARAAAVLGDVLLTADPPLRAPWRAIEQFELAWTRGQIGAALTLAAIHYAACGVPADDSRAQGWLERALAAGHAPARRVAGMLAHLAGRTELAEALLREAAAADDAFAQHALGVMAQRAGDLPLARAWFARGAARGLPPSVLHLAVLGATPAASLPAAADRPPLATAGIAFPPPLRADEPQDELLAPATWRCREVLDPLLCDYLMAASTPWMVKSMTTDPNDGRSVPDPARTSWGMNFAYAFPDICVAYAERRIAARAGRSLVQAEPLAVLRYQVGQEYRLHHDYMAPGALTENPYYRRVGQRVATMVTYLNLPGAGGGTDFPRRGIVVTPELGAGVLFTNTLADGRPDPDSLHAGLPVLRGEKWVATLWFRERLVRETAPAPTGASR